MRFALAVLLVIHGAIHLPGFVKAWDLAPVPQIRGLTLVRVPASFVRGIGLAWLSACVLLVVAAALLLSEQSWWGVAAAGVLLSQTLVLVAWPEAKAGTLPNLALALAVTVGAASARFDQGTDAMVRELFASTAAATPTQVRAEELRGLPVPVRRWLEASGVPGREREVAVRLRQRGFLRTSPEGSWLPATAEEYFSVDEPGFVWSVGASMGGVLPVTGRDTYRAGKGRMRIELLSLLPMVDAADDRIDRSSLLRFLGEIVWFPSAALRPYLTWTAIDDASARASMTYRGVTASAVFTIDDRGRFVQLGAERHLGSGVAATLEPWLVSAHDWRAFAGITVPVRGKVVWRLASGDFDYYRWEIVDVEYNRPFPYPPS